MAKSITLQDKALRKMLAHVLKHHKSDCIGVLLGSRTEDSFTVTDCVPLFHDRVYTSSLEAAFNAIQWTYADSTIIGVYDAPLKYKSGEAIPFTSLAVNIAEQIKLTREIPDSLAISVRAPPPKDEEDDDEPKTKEITDE